MAKQNLKNFETSGNLAEVQAVYKSKVKPSDRIKITSSQDAYEAIKSTFDENTIEYQEQMVLLLLNRANKVLGWVKLSSGGMAGTVCDGKIIFTVALQTGASAIILAHNHPSGNLQPSNADIELTKRIKQAGLLLDIQVLDHLIVTYEDQYYSLADNGLF